MRRAIFFLILILVINTVGMYYRWYDSFGWFDTALHFSGGFFVAMLFAHYLPERISSDHILKDILIVVGVAVFIGVIWEFAEYLGSQLLVEPIYKYYKIRAYFIGDLSDTIKDLFMDTLGALSYALIWLKTRKRVTSS